MPGGASSVSFRPVDSSQICALRLSPTDVDLIAIGYSSGLVALVHLRNGKVLFRCTTAHDEVQSLAFSPSGEFLAFSSKDKIITVIKLASTTTSIESQVLKTHKAGKNSGGDPRSWISLCWNESSVKDPEFWSSTPNGDIMTWNLDLHSTRLVHGHSRAIFQLLHLPSLNALISISMDRNIILWDVRKKTKIWDMSTLGGYVYAIAEHPLDPSLVALACGDNSIRIWFNQECISALEDEASGASKGQNQASKFSNGSSTISGSRLSTVLVWKGITGKVTCIQWHPANTNELAFGMADGTISIYNMTTQQCSPLQQRHQQTVYDIRYAPSGDGDRYAILSVGGESKVLVHDSSGASLKFQETAEAANPNYMALLSSGIGKTINSLPKRSGLDFSLTGDLVFLGNTDGSCELYSYPELKLLHCNRNHLKLVNKVRWNRCSADARFRQFAATASEDGAICIYNFALLPTFDPLVKTLAAKGRKRSVVDISWSPSNPNRLVAANSDGTVSYWDIDSEQETLASPQYHGKSKVISVLWSSTLEGNLIFSGSEDQSMAINHFRSHSYSLSETNSSPSSTVTNETSHGGSNSRMQGIREAVVHRQDYSRTSASASSIATTSFDSNTTSGGTKATKQRNAAAKSGSTSHATSQASGSHRLGGIHWNESENPLDTISQLLSTGKRDSAEQEGTWLPKPLSTSDGPSPDSIQQQFMLSYWKGDVAQTLLSVIHQGALNDMWVGLSASGGFEL
jgi:WD40 repeat protein